MSTGAHDHESTRNIPSSNNPVEDNENSREQTDLATLGRLEDRVVVDIGDGARVFIRVSFLVVELLVGDGGRPMFNAGIGHSGSVVKSGLQATPF